MQICENVPCDLYSDLIRPTLESLAKTGPPPTDATGQQQRATGQARYTRDSLLPVLLRAIIQHEESMNSVLVNHEFFGTHTYRQYCTYLPENIFQGRFFESPLPLSTNTTWDVSTETAILIFGNGPACGFSTTSRATSKR